MTPGNKQSIKLGERNGAGDYGGLRGRPPQSFFMLSLPSSLARQSATRNREAGPAHAEREGLDEAERMGRSGARGRIPEKERGAEWGAVRWRMAGAEQYSL